MSIILATALWLSFLFNGGDHRASAYCIKGRTASGTQTRRGIVAADPRKYPLGTKIRITGTNGFDGVYTVADTGGAIRGLKLDIWLPSCSQAVKFGVKKVKVERI